KSASVISSVQAALPAAPGVTVPGGADRSIVHALLGLERLNRNTVLTFSAVAGFAATSVPIARKMSVLFGTAAPPPPPPPPPAGAEAAAGLLRSFGFGISVHSSIAAFEMQISPRSLIFVRKMMRVSLSFHISVT